MRFLKWQSGEVTTHDYSKRRRTAGHDYVFTPIDGGMHGRMIGWGRGINANDFLLLENDGDTTRYRVDGIEYLSDPPDMWRASVTFVPRGPFDG